MITLYGYWRSSAAYRVRIALNIKQIAYQPHNIHLVKGGGEQHLAHYVALNPAHLVPTLVDGDRVLNQSMAIIEYLDEQYPGQSLLPENAFERAIVRGLAQTIACEIHPLNNLRVLQHLESDGDFTNEQKLAWISHWISDGFKALELQLAKTSARYCFGERVSLADLCLIPQLYNARRFNICLEQYPNILKIEANCLALDAFKKALPENQPDAQ